MAFCLAFIYGTAAQAQHLETGITGGGSLYTGDLNPVPQPSLFQPAGGLIVRYNFTTRWAWKTTLITGRIKGEDLTGEVLSGRSLSFESSLTEFSSHIEFNFLEYFTGSRRDRFSPYLFGGLGVFFFNPMVNFNGQLVELQPLHTEGQDTRDYPDRTPYSRVQFAFPFGMGMKLSLGKKVSIGVEVGYRKTLTDYLDDVSTTYYLEGNTIDPAVAAEYLSDQGRNHSAGMQRGNSRTSDWYAYAGFFLTYKFNLYKTPPCNDFKNIQRFD